MNFRPLYGRYYSEKQLTPQAFSHIVRSDLPRASPQSLPTLNTDGSSPTINLES